jgi:hypothetical protein
LSTGCLVSVVNLDSFLYQPSGDMTQRQALLGWLLSFDAMNMTEYSCIDQQMSITESITIAQTSSWSGHTTLLSAKAMAYMLYKTQMRNGYG